MVKRLVNLKNSVTEIGLLKFSHSFPKGSNTKINLKNLSIMKKTLKLMAALFVGAMFMSACQQAEEPAVEPEQTDAV